MDEYTNFEKGCFGLDDTCCRLRRPLVKVWKKGLRFGVFCLIFAAHSIMLLFLLFLLEQLEGVVIVLMNSYAHLTSAVFAGTDVHEDFV